ncbi:tetratricopeptide repeat protein [Planctomicrobium sp. SH527]|uniref:tetratricopeptide repeat protein n=1 Tax=Planctomicrobium sp. SH527 TaxID=3448123 RepID=UPI003F5B6B8A
MDDSHEQSDELDRQFEMRTDRAEKMFLDCHLRSAVQLAKETTRQAKQYQRANNYLYGLFDLMRFGHGMLDPVMTRDAAVELVLLLQDEEQARRIQPDLDEGLYHWICSWMSSCAYDNLAEATGMMSGYNSPGMQECINDGIQVCRQTGKMECIKCFREYAADVYLAADDLAMVRHQCQTLMEVRDEDNNQKDRRSSTLQKLAWVNILEGRLQRALRDLDQALSLSNAEKVYTKLRSTILVNIDRHELRLLIGETVAPIPEGLPDFEAGEWPRLEFECEKLTALSEVMTGQLDAGIARLTELDRRLTEIKSVKDWFEIRLRLIAAYLLHGKRSRAIALGKGLEARATEAQDYLTLRRWKRLMDESVAPCAIPLLADPDAGPFCVNKVTEEVALQASDEDEIEHGFENDPDDEIIQEVTPLSETLSQYMHEIMDSEKDEETRRDILDQMLSHEPSSIEDAGDAAYLVHLSRYVIQGPDDAMRIWPWADAIRRHFTEDATVLSVVATLGHFFRNADPENFGELINREDIDKWFRLSMSMNPNHPRNHSRAGNYFLDEDLHGDAERAFSRAFRLDRADGATAHQLAELYRETERPRDAMAVLDICLRKGSKDANVAWEAAMTALQLKQYDMQLTYLDRHQVLAEKVPVWHHYYRGLALFHLGRYEECLKELDEELERRPPGLFHIHVIRVCAYTEMGQLSDARPELEKLLEISLVDVDYLSFHGLVRAAEVLCDSIVLWPEDDVLRHRLIQRFLKAGLVADSYFNMLRETRRESGDIHFYRVQIQQPLDDHWKTSEGCLPGQEDWPDYLIDWGVLAETQQEAIDMVLAFQEQCESALPLLMHVDASEEIFRDRPGVVWQGYRRHEVIGAPDEDDYSEHDPDLDD